MEEDGNIIAGVGDEVVLFILFLVISILLIFYLSRRRGRRVEGVNQDEINDDHVTENNDNQGEPRDHHMNENENVRQRNILQEENVTVRLVTLQSSQTLTISSNTSLDEIQRVYFATEYDERRRIRFIYQGHVISDMNTTLSENNIRDNSSIHVHIGQHSQTTQDRNPDQIENEGLLDLSFLFVPLFGLMLGIIWISFMIWPSVFSLLTKVMLFMLSLGYVYLVFNMQFTS